MTTFISCLNQSTTSTTSSEARVHSFTFHQDTLNPGLTEPTYIVEHTGDTGRIYSVDSLRYGTRMDSVVPYITYKVTPGQATFVFPDTNIISTGADTLNFNQSPIYLHVLASDMENEQWYKFDIHVHQADPDLFVWKQLSEQLFPAQNCETKAFFHQGKLLVVLNNGLATQVYQSADGISWEQLTDKVASLPSLCYVRDILQHDDNFYYIADNILYTSTDGLVWQQQTNNTQYTLVNMLMSYHNQAWCLVQNQAEQLQLATITTDGNVAVQQIVGLADNVLPSNFPISDYATASFKTSSERPRAMIVGGRNIEGDAVNTRWNIEYTSGNYRLKDFSMSQTQFETLTGASIIQYEEQLLMFGGMNKDVNWQADMLCSDDEGMSWVIPDTAHNQLPSGYTARTNPSVCLDNDNNIYIIGGQSKTGSLGDVYRGYLNSAKWK